MFLVTLPSDITFIFGCRRLLKIHNLLERFHANTFYHFFASINFRSPAHLAKHSSDLRLLCLLIVQSFRDSKMVAMSSTARFSSSRVENFMVHTTWGTTCHQTSDTQVGCVNALSAFRPVMLAFLD